MRRRHVGEPRALGPAPGARHVEAVVVDGGGLDASTGGEERAPRAEVVRLLEQHRVPGIDEHARDQVERLLRARGDEHLPGPAVDAARAADVLDDRVAQGPFALGRAVVEVAPRRAARAAGEESRPRRRREVLVGGKTVTEVEARARRERGAEPGEARDAPAVGGESDGARVRGSARRALRERLGELRSDVGSRALARARVALAEELVVGGEHGIARHGELRGERARRRQALAGAQGSGEDPRPQGTVDPHHEGAFAFEWNQHDRRPGEKWLLNLSRDWIFA